MRTNSLICGANLIIYGQEFNNLQHKLLNLHHKLKFSSILETKYLYAHNKILIRTQQNSYTRTTKFLYAHINCTYINKFPVGTINQIKQILDAQRGMLKRIMP